MTGHRSEEVDLSVTDRADRGWNFDPMFHARVERAVALTVQEMGGHATAEQKGVARHAAAVALVLTDEEVVGHIGSTVSGESSQ